MGKKVMESQLLKIIAMEVAKRRIVMLAIVMEAAKKVMESQLLKTIVMEVVKRRMGMVAMVAMSTKAAKKVMESQLLKIIVMEVVKRRVTMVAMVAMVAMGIKVVKKINPGTNLWYQQLKNMGTKATKEKIAMIAMDMGMDILNQLPKEDAVMDVIGAAVI